MEFFLFYTILVLMALFLLAWGNSFGGWERFLWRMASRAPSLLPGRGTLLPYEHFVEKGVISAGFFHPFLTKRIALLPYEHFAEKGVIFAGFFHPFLTKRIALLLYEHFFQKGVIIWIPESPKIPDLLPIDDFLQKGVIFA